MKYRRPKGTNEGLTLPRSRMRVHLGPTTENHLHDTTWKRLHKKLHTVKGPYQDVQGNERNSFKDCCKQRRANCVCIKTDDKVEG